MSLKPRVAKKLHESLLHHAGIHHPKLIVENVLKTPIHTAVLHRLPWLVIGLGGGLLTAQIITGFIATLENNLLLAGFIPLMVYMTDAVGTQIEAFFIRDYAPTPNFQYHRYFLKHLTIVSTLAAILGGTLFIVASIVFRHPALGVVLGLSLGLGIISSVFTGLFIPYLFSKAKLDPANTTGPIATIIQDFVTIVIYFSIASLLL